MAIEWLAPIAGLIGASIGAIVGAGISFYVQTQTQKRAWKREYAIKISDSIYGPMYIEIEQVLRQMSYEPFSMGFWLRDWAQIKKTYQHLMMDEKLKQRIDLMNDIGWTSTERTQRVRNITGMILEEEARKTFPEKGGLLPEFEIDPNGSRHIDFFDSFVRQEHPAIMASKDKNIASIKDYFIGFPPFQGQPATRFRYEGETKTKFDELWSNCHKRFEETPEVKDARKEYPETLHELERLKEELARYIQEPWRV
jgi:hypothetical protein